MSVSSFDNGSSSFDFLHFLRPKHLTFPFWWLCADSFDDHIYLTAWRVSKYGVISGPNTGKYGPEITPYLDTLHATSVNVFQYSADLLDISIPRAKLTRSCHKEGKGPCAML